jgi:sporulation protein YlmC with PRC-barrel domain
MVILRDDEIHGLPVLNAAGEKVGTVSGLSVDAGNHAVARYAVTRSRLLSALLPSELLVAPSQVISLDRERMVVEDAAIGEGVEARRLASRQAGLAQSAEPAQGVATMGG